MSRFSAESATSFLDVPLLISILGHFFEDFPIDPGRLIQLGPLPFALENGHGGIPSHANHAILRVMHDINFRGNNIIRYRIIAKSVKKLSRNNIHQDDPCKYDIASEINIAILIFE